VFFGKGAKKHLVFVYNFFMLLTADEMRVLLFFGMFCMAVLAAFFLRGRSLSRREYLVWGTLLVVLPLVGPFLVILLHPGNSHQKSSISG